MLQRAANRLGLVAIKAGETGAEQLAVALGDDRFGKRIGLGEQAVGLAAGGFDALLSLVFAFERADLDDPSGVDRDRIDGGVLRGGPRLRCRRGIGRGRLIRDTAAEHAGGGKQDGESAQRSEDATTRNETHV